MAGLFGLTAHAARLWGITPEKSAKMNAFKAEVRRSVSFIDRLEMSAAEASARIANNNAWIAAERERTSPSRFQDGGGI